MKRIAFIISLIIVTGCHVGPRYRPPRPTAPAVWKNPDPVENALPNVCYWWEIFCDETLNSLENQAIRSNPDLFIAMSRIEQAWAIAGVSRSELYPQVNLNPKYSSTGSLFKVFLPPGALPLQNQNITTPFRVHQMQYLLPFNLSFELDLWGKFCSLNQAARRHAQAEQEAYRIALLRLTSDLATTYFNLRYLDTTILIYQEIIEARRKFYELTQSRYTKGLTTYDDVASASIQVTNAESEYYEARKLRGIEENKIAVLLGSMASEFQCAPMPIEQSPPAIPAGLPSTILKRRPDIAQAERTMASSQALVRVAYASFFPSFQLTGILGFSSPDFKDFLSWKSRLWSIGANASQVIFDAGRLNSTLRLACAHFAESSQSYRKTVLNAFQEVENALNDIQYLKEQSDALYQSLIASEKLSRLTLNRYKKGLGNYLTVINSQEFELNAKTYFIAVLAARYQATIQLVKALGGSWDRPCFPNPKG